MGEFCFAPYQPTFTEDPYPVYETMRRDAPVLVQPEWDLTFLSRYADVRAILRDRRFGRDIRHVIPVEELSGRHAERFYPTHHEAWYRYVRSSFMELEPPAHTRIRSLLAIAFTTRRVEGLRPMLETEAGGLLDSAIAAGQMEVIADYATPLPLTAIGELLGIGQGDWPRLVAWSHDIVALFDLNASDEAGEKAEAAAAGFAGYLREAIGARRTHLGPDLLSAMISAEVDGEQLTEDELIATSMLLLNAGHEATVHAIGNAVLALARHPGQYALLRSHPELLSSAVEELLRYDTPLQMFDRWVLEDLDWNGHRLRQGDKVGLLLGSANRDGERYPEPDRLDLTRDDSGHMAFGAGLHRCIGAPLARLEMEVALGALVRRAPSLGLVDETPRRRRSLVFRGVEALHLEIG